MFVIPEVGESAKYMPIAATAKICFIVFEGFSARNGYRAVPPRALSCTNECFPVEVHGPFDRTLQFAEIIGFSPPITKHVVVHGLLDDDVRAAFTLRLLQSVFVRCLHVEVDSWNSDRFIPSKYASTTHVVIAKWERVGYKVVAHLDDGLKLDMKHAAKLLATEAPGFFEPGSPWWGLKVALHGRIDPTLNKGCDATFKGSIAIQVPDELDVGSLGERWAAFYNKYLGV